MRPRDCGELITSPCVVMNETDADRRGDVAEQAGLTSAWHRMDMMRRTPLATT